MGVGVFWGIILIVFGIGIILKVIFGVSVFRILIAVFFILIGLKILVGKSAININSNEKDVIFNDRRYTVFPDQSTEFNTIFGKSTYDFRDAKMPVDLPLELEFSAIFGHTELLLPPGLGVKIKAEAVFGSIQLPNNNTVNFGDSYYTSKHDTITDNLINIKASAVFGNIEIRQ